MANDTTPPRSLADRFMPHVAERHGIIAMTPEERAIAAVDRLGSRMRLDAERASVATDRGETDDRER